MRESLAETEETPEESPMTKAKKLKASNEKKKVPSQKNVLGSKKKNKDIFRLSLILQKPYSEE